MTGYTVVAFKWSGTGYNATYNTSHTAVLSDNDGAYQGAGDTDELVSIDGGTAAATVGQPYSIDISFTDTDGAPHVETFCFFNTGGSWYFVPAADSQFSDGATLGSYQGHTVGWDYSSIVCFANGTLIETLHGPTPIEDLVPGTLVQVFDGGYQPLRLNMRRKVSGQELHMNPKLRPIKIVRDALGVGFPNSDLRVSRQHRLLIASGISKRMFGCAEALIPAIKLTKLPGCFIDTQIDDVSYFHLVFDQHEIVYANGTPSESFYPGPEAIKSISQEAKQEFFQLFPDTFRSGDLPKHARFVPENRLQKKLIERHVKNDQPLIKNRLAAYPAFADGLR